MEHGPSAGVSRAWAGMPRFQGMVMEACAPAQLESTLSEPKASHRSYSAGQMTSSKSAWSTTSRAPTPTSDRSGSAWPAGGETPHRKRPGAPSGRKYAPDGSTTSPVESNGGIDAAS